MKSPLFGTRFFLFQFCLLLLVMGSVTRSVHGEELQQPKAAAKLFSASDIRTTRIIPSIMSILEDEPAPTCTDNRKNGSETAVDCGGATCAKCAPGLTCLAPSDCVSSVCTGGICAQALCFDSVKNGTETDIDCGGTCPKCNVGQTCAVPTDCASSVCTGGVCAQASCMDNVKNGAETDVDCGGPLCPSCSVGKSCSSNGDCVSGHCNQNLCAPPAPPDSAALGKPASR